MKRLFLILAILALAGSAQSQVLLADSCRSIASTSIGSGYSSRPVAHETNGRLYAFPDSGASDGKRTLVSYSSDFGATWTIVSSSAWGNNDISWAQHATIIEDTVYLVNGINGIVTRILKWKNGTLAAMDTASTSVQSYGYDLSFTYDADTPLVYVDAGADGVGDRGHFISYGGGRWPTSWTEGTATTDTLVTPANPFDKRCPAFNGFLRLDISSTAAGDLDFVDKNTNKELNGSFLRCEGDEPQNLSMAAKDYDDTLVCFAWELADSVTARIGRINTTDTTWTTITTTMLSPLTARHGNLDQKRSGVAVAWGGDSCYVFYKIWADTTNYDNAAICYKVTGNNGTNWSAERTLLAAVDGTDLRSVTVPERFDFSGDVDIVWAVYQTTVNAASTNNIYFISDTVATAGAAASGARLILGAVNLRGVNLAKP